jgi:hypothetical protein
MSGERQESTAVAVRSVSALPIANMSDLAQAGQFLAASGIFGIKNAAAGFCVAATCHQQGISLMEFRRTYHMTAEGPSMRADAMAAEFRNRGGRYEIIENSTERAAARFEFEDQDIEFSYSMDDARRTGDCFNGDGKTLKYNWSKRPDDMLWARMISRAVRRLCPEINAGLYSPEEMQDVGDDAPAQRQAPRALTADEVQSRVRVVDGMATERPAQTAPTPAPFVEQDCTIIPEGFGEFSGRRWDECDDETLSAALESDALDAGYKAAVRIVIEERKGVVA